MTDTNIKKIISTQEELENYFKEEKETGRFYTCKHIKNIEFNFPKNDPGIINNTVFYGDNAPNLTHLIFEDCIFNNVLFVDLRKPADCLLFKNCDITGQFANCEITRVIGFSNCKLKRINLLKARRGYDFIKNCLTMELILEDCKYDSFLILSRNNISKLMVYDSKGYFKKAMSQTIKREISALLRLRSNNITSLYLKRKDALLIYKTIRSQSSGEFKNIIIEEAGGKLKRYSIIRDNIHYYTDKNLDSDSYELNTFFDYYVGNLGYYYFNDINNNFSICYDELTNAITLDNTEYDYSDFKNDLINNPDKFMNIIPNNVLDDILLYIKKDKEFLKLKEEYHKLNNNNSDNNSDNDEYRDTLISKMKEHLNGYRYKYFNNYIKPKLLLFCSYIDRINSINNSIKS